MIDDKVKMMASDKMIRDLSMIERNKRLIFPGTLLKGAKVTSGSGIKEWFPFPRYRVVAMHMDGKRFFCEILDQGKDQVQGQYRLFSLDDNDWDFWSNR